MLVKRKQRLESSSGVRHDIQYKNIMTLVKVDAKVIVIHMEPTTTGGGPPGGVLMEAEERATMRFKISGDKETGEVEREARRKTLSDEFQAAMFPNSYLSPSLISTHSAIHFAHCSDRVRNFSEL